MNRFRYRQLLLLVALVLPSLVIAELGRRNFDSEHVDTALQPARKIAASAIAQTVLTKLERIKQEELQALSSGTGKFTNTAVSLLASVSESNGQNQLAWHFRFPVFSQPLLDACPKSNEIEFSWPSFPEASTSWLDACQVLTQDITAAGGHELALEYKSAAGSFRAALAILQNLKGTSAEASEQIEKHIHELDLAAEIQKDFPILELNEQEWKPYEQDELWLSMTPLARETLLIAVQRKEIVDQVGRELKDNRREMPFYVMHTFSNQESNALYQTLGVGFPDILIDLPSLQDDSARGLVEHQRNYAVSLALVLSLTLIGWYLLQRDTFREGRVAAMRSQFVSNVSHELKTPLAAIRLFAETLQMRGSTDPKIQEEFLNTIVNESERLTRLLKNVLDFSLIEHGQKSYQLEPTRLADVALSAARTMQFPLSQQGFNLRVDIAEGIPMMRVDRDSLEQAILNLLSNAMKYSGESRDIVLSLHSDKKGVLIEVVDHGIGIAPEERARIFERFYRVASPENRSIPGSGLGLSLIAHFAEGHGGTVDVESAPGRGSTFTLRIPFNFNGSHS